MQKVCGRQDKKSCLEMRNLTISALLLKAHCIPFLTSRGVATLSSCKCPNPRYQIPLQFLHAPAPIKKHYYEGLHSGIGAPISTQTGDPSLRGGKGSEAAAMHKIWSNNPLVEETASKLLRVCQEATKHEINFQRRFWKKKF